MKLKTLTIACTLALGFSTTVALAESPSFSYIEARYVELDEANTTFDGYEAELSGRLGRYSFLSLNYADVSGDWAGFANANLEMATARLGFIFGENQPLVAYVGPQVSYIKTNYGPGTDGSWNSEGDSTTEWGAFGGVRAMVLPRVEVNTEISYIDFDRESFTSYSVGTRVYLTQNLAATGQLRMGDLDGFSIGVSYQF
ncbi:hypothetical protein A28LD_0966 [Idiomarina sp. A28L]|uniref:outer membrane protein n=1 Tax=Idiomarina sp. A28L TaxID=1036674 RepID=UPI0002138B1E|nr:hypothetical protein [Idiomarina sp. A28L]EGN75353.1 hypothetical protein A28LD_0966 [Idiomarina sp. A28L]